MPPKKAKKGKTKGKQAEQEAPIDPYLKSLKEKTIEELKEEEKSWKEKSQKEMRMRSLALCDRDQGQQLYNSLCKEYDHLQAETRLQEHKMQEESEAHDVEMKQLEMAVKHHLSFHETELEKVEAETEAERSQEQELHEEKLKQIKKAKDFVAQQQKQAIDNQEKALQSLSVNIDLMKQRNQEFLDELKTKLDAKVKFYVNIWTLRRRVELQEIEERKNRHIATLCTHHRAAFAKTKEYYNQVTQNNLKIIRSLKKEIEDAYKRNEAIVHDQARMTQSIEDIRAQRRPVEDTLEKLREDIASFEKDVSVLHSTRTHNIILERQLRQLEHDHNELEKKYQRVQKEKSGIEKRYEEVIEAIRQRGMVPSRVIVGRMRATQQGIMKRDEQIESVVVAGELDPASVQQLAANLDEMIAQKNRVIDDLNYQIIRVTKAHNDAVHVLEAKLLEMGVKEEDLGKRPTVAETIPTPAGLVSAVL
ncbi:putative Growth arrest-specific protein 8 [Monocercomonoides exilis]|uniref:putative Growth arrest-specific protein 8 n=1 Tax=Monocercomonoides exilis TaxID=2049356 RepID=UPI0035593F4E|nr:putative Growth arrest-specific protein 8 [Monocercomonoides exilis]|eukprot:MONOS_11508.1-p1 / transcript=MONOS_11508.1 / gene=MONOS_11508 / organism=Monocercomonoides_exilis_PA203 / gene_product=Growth arrest-specific protein 8 / transcript_product=Growth arrest-specific protein 8 / location=Mono_scaffold00581:39154-41161(+) / protein_length=475 / sequence_SO=supercontig / SO=protein_coding / is_pseudo=false